MQTRIDSNKDLNRDSYFKAIAERIITSPGKPVDWGKNEDIPVEFGLALSTATSIYELEIDKISRLSNLNGHPLSHLDLVKSSKLNNIAFAIKASQIITIDLEQINNYTSNTLTYVTLKVSTTIDSMPLRSNLGGYLIAQNYQYNITAETSNSGVCEITVNYPAASINDALLVVFARSTFDERLTSYSIYKFGNNSQEVIPSNNILSLSPQNYSLYYNESLGTSIQKVYAITYSCQYTTISLQEGYCAIPKLINASPIVLIVCGSLQGHYFQEWSSYPQIPLTLGSNFANSGSTIFPYTVLVNGVLYKVDLSLGGIVS